MQSTLTVYKASAGSGKTFTLAVEYITLLLSTPVATDFRHILAVTFTNKATAEMKDRILQQLYGLANALPESKNYYDAVSSRLEERGIHISEDELRRRASNVLSAILHDFNYFRVETIDSFFQSVLRNLAHELGLTANLEVELNTTEVLSRAVDRIVDTLQFMPEVQRWILNYVTEQIENNEKWDITRGLKSFSHCIFEESFQNRTPQQRERLNDDKVITSFRKRMNEIEEEGKRKITDEADALDKYLQEGILSYDRISNGKNYRSALLSIKELRYDGEKTKTLKNAAEDSLKMLKAADKKNDAMQAEAAKVAAQIVALLDTYDQEMTQIASSRLARKHINPLRLLGCIEETANQICKENNQFLLNRTPILLGQLVENSDAPFVFEKIGTQLRHIMIDEFQDTSLQQWKNFRVLLFENQSVGGRDLVVGDVKQSIYRWRNGDWGVLHGIEQEMKALSPKSVQLDTNFRSHEHVIKFNNAFFPEAANLLDSLSPNARFKISDIYADVEQKCKEDDDKGYVGVHLYANGDDYEERFVMDMIRQIRTLMQMGVPLSEMAILVRKRKMGSALIEHFHRLAPDILLVSDEAFLLSSGIAAQMIVNALRVLADPQGNNPVPLHFLVKHYMSDVKGLPTTPQDYAIQGVEQNLPSEFLECREELATLPLYILCERLYRIFGLSQIPGQAAYMFAFYDQLQTYLRSHPSDLRSFLQAWDEKIANEPIPCGKIPGLRIMTIHQSKGLQFHTVLLPYTDWLVEKDMPGDMLWCEPQTEPYNELGLLPISTQGQKNISQSIFSPWNEEEHLQKRVDAINTLYVAFTRAECNLFIWGKTAKKISTTSLAGDLLYCGIALEEKGDEYTYSCGTLMGTVEKETRKTENRMTPPMTDLSLDYSSFKPHLDFMQSNESSRFLREANEEGLEGQDYMELGKILHYVLSQIEHIDDVERVLAKCRQQGLIADERQQASLLRRIQKGMENEMIRSWFSADKEVYNECNIAYTNTETGLPEVCRPDRVVISGDELTVIDFKCGRSWPKYEGQVRDYMTQLALMYPGMKIKGYLWYIYTGRVCEVGKTDALP